MIDWLVGGQITISSSEGSNEYPGADGGIILKLVLDISKKIFSEYTQLNNPERDRNKGLGLGLAIVTRLCKLQDIPYDFQSAIGAGTAVKLTVKMGDAALTPINSHRPQQSMRKLTILFVDDEQAIRDGMKMIISSRQCRAVIAADKEQALEKIGALDHDLDVIISDLRLRDNVTGTELVADIREELNRDVPAVIVTGDTAVDRLELVKSENVALLHKPVSPEELREEVQRLIATSDQS